MKNILKHLGITKKHIILFSTIVGICEIIQIIVLSLLFKNFFLIFIIELIIHYMILYYLIHTLLFSGSSTIITKIHCYRLGVKIATNFREQLNKFRENLNDFFSSNKTNMNYNDLYEKLKVINNINETIYSYLKITGSLQYDEMSNYQKNIIISLNRLKMSIDESKIEKIILKCAERYSMRKKFIYKHRKLDIALIGIQSNVARVVELINQYLLKGGFFNNIFNIFFNNAFGSLKQLKTELKNRFYCEEFRVTTDKNNYKLDCVLIKNKEIEKERIKYEIFKGKNGEKKNLKNEDKETNEKKEIDDENKKKGDTHDSETFNNTNDIINKNTRSDSHKLELIQEENKGDNKGSSSSGGEDNKNYNHVNKLKKETENSISNNENIENNNNLNKYKKEETVIIICNRSSLPFELLAYYDKWIEFYLSYGLNVVVWNYRGYGESEGYPSIDNLQEDAEKIVEFIKSEYQFKKIGVHGIYMGCICAASLYIKNMVQFCFLDRCFSSLYTLIEQKTDKKISKILKFFKIKDIDIGNLISEKIVENSKDRNRINYNNNNFNNNIDNNNNNCINIDNDSINNNRLDNCYLVFSYDCSNNIINDNSSIKSVLSTNYYKNVYDNNNSDICMKIFENNKKKYDDFVEALEYIRHKIEALIHKKEIENKLVENNNKNSNYLNNVSVTVSSTYDPTIKNNDNLYVNTTDRLIDNYSNNSSINLTIHSNSSNSNQNSQKSHIFISIFQLLSKLDAGGSNLMRYNRTSISHFFYDILFFGSPRIGVNSANSRAVAIAAVFGKIENIKKKIEKYLKKNNFNIDEINNEQSIDNNGTNNCIKINEEDKKTENKMYIFLNGLKLLLKFLNKEILKSDEANLTDSEKLEKINEFVSKNNICELILFDLDKDDKLKEQEFEAYYKHLANSKFI